jgi:hypothetical protein
MKALLFSLIILFLWSSLAAGQEVPSPDRWRGLLIGDSTAEDAVGLFGKPESDKPDRLLIWRIRKWFIPGLNKKTLRKQTFRGMDGFDRVDLYYYEERLAVVQLDFSRELDPNALKNIYGIEFVPFIERMAEAFFPADFERHQGKMYPKTYPDDYSLVAVGDRAIVCASISNGGIGSMLAKVAKVPDSPAAFPGKVRMLQLISRKLENRQGADLLK